MNTQIQNEGGVFLDFLDISQSYILPNNASVFQAEIFAICLDAMASPSRHGNVG